MRYQSFSARSAFLVFIVLLAVAALTPTVRAAWTPVPGSPLANSQHPRLLITPQSLPALKSKLGTGGVWHEDFKGWVAWADAEYSSALSGTPADRPFLAVDYALLWLTYPVAGVSYGHSQADYGSIARALLLNLTTLDVQVGNNYWFGLPIAYDWAYGALSQADRQTLGAFMKTIDQWSFTGSGISPFNSQVTAARAQKMLSGLAMVGDGIDDAWAVATLNRYGEYYSDQTGTTRSESDLGGEDGATGQGPAYTFTYTAQHLLLAEEGWRTANGLSGAAHYGQVGKSFIRRMPQYLAYTLLPWANTQSSLPNGRRYVMWNGAYSNANTGASETAFQSWLTALAGMLQEADPRMAGLAQWLINERSGRMTAGGPYYAREWALWKFVLGNRASPMSPDDLGLPVSRSFREGLFIFRTGWNNLNDTFVTFTANEWMRSAYGMSPLYPGGFTIDRKGPQVVRQSVRGHDWGSHGAGPSNILLFVDSTLSAATGPYDDEGGARFLPTDMRGSIDFVQNGQNDLRDRVRFLGADAPSGRDVDYVMADVTRAYNSTRFNDGYNPARVSDVVRQLVYFRPANPGTGSDYVVVFDRATSTDTKFEKRWLFHTSGEPMVNGSVTVGQPVRNGSGEGKWTYMGASLVTATNTVGESNGRTFLTPLLPSSRRIVKVGGPNSSGQSWQTDSHEFETPFGVIVPRYIVPDADTEQYAGRYRVEVIPTVPALKDVFLNVIEVTDANAGSPTAAAALSGTDLVAARVGNRIAAFSRNTDSVAGGEFSIDQGGTYRIHLADLSPVTEYQVTVGGNMATLTASAAGTLYIERAVSAGARVTVQRIGQAAQQVPSAPANVRIVQ